MLERKIHVTLATPSPISHRTAEENLGLGYLGSALRNEGYEVNIVDGWLSGMSPHQIAESIIKSPPELFLGFSCYRSNMEKTMEIAYLLKEVGIDIPLVVGGFGPTFHPQEFIDAGFDIVVMGEGEETIVDLANQILGENLNLYSIPGICFKDGEKTIFNPIRPLKEDLDSLPFPSRDTMQLVIDRKTPLHILSARGCQASCVFCSIVSFQRLAKGPKWRERSINNFVSELELLNNQGARHFKVIDDSLIEPPRGENWCKELADEIESRGVDVRLRGSIRADRVTDQIIFNLKRAGFFAFSCGIENFSPTALKRMGKSATLEDNIRALEIFQKYGIIVQAGHILFDHGTTMSELEENYHYMRRFTFTVSKGIFTEMYAAEGTPFTRLLGNKGLVLMDPRGLGNNTYEVQDPEARKAYRALKIWQKSHSRIYDKTIDPLSAPKSLEEHELSLFHPLSVELRNLDLDFMREILDLIYTGISEDDLISIVEQYIDSTQEWYENFEKRVDLAYTTAGLTYDADINPFL